MKAKIFNRALLLAICCLLAAPCCRGASVIKASVRPTRVNTVKNTSFDAAQLLYHWTFDGNDMTWSTPFDLVLRSHVPGTAASTLVWKNPQADVVDGPRQGASGQSYRFNGSNSKCTNSVNLTNVSLMTISMWVYPDYVLAWNQDKMIIEGGAADWGAQTNAIIIDTGSGSRNFSIGIRDPANLSNARLDFFANTNGFPVSNVWYHCAFVFNNTTATGSTKAYINGAPITLTNSVNTKSAAGNFGNHLWSWGGRGSGASQFTFLGRLDDIKIYTNELTQAQVTELSTNRVTVIR